MDTETLVADSIDDGQKLIQEVSHGGFSVTAAFWLKESVKDKWYFYIVSPIVDDEGLRQAYERLHPLVFGLKESVGIEPLSIKLIGPSNPIAKDVIAIQNSKPAPRTRPMRWSGMQLGNVSIEGAWLYPLPVATT